MYFYFSIFLACAFTYPYTCLLLLQEVNSWSSIDDVNIVVDFSFLETPSKGPSSSSSSYESSINKAKNALKTLLSLEMGTL